VSIKIVIFVDMEKNYNQDLSGMNTFRMKVSCRCFVEYTSEEELRAILSDSTLPRPLFPIGGGSNLLFTGDYPGTVLHCGMKAISPLGEGRVYADAGVVWDEFCAWCASEGLWGPENLSLIPGEVGAAAVQNIGAYGREACELIESVRCIDVRDCSIVTIPAGNCGYGYRESRFKHDWKGRYIVTGVTFKMSSKSTPELDYGHVREAVVDRYGEGALPTLTPAMVREVVIGIRRGKLPEVSELGSAGSFFRNPYVDSSRLEAVREIAEKENYGPVPFFEAGEGSYKIPAAWMIDKCGWKGKRLGGAGVYEKQPLVLVNLSGSAEPGEIIALEEKIRASVLEKFGVSLEKEVEYV
jgi:UDP-N-acetylmuramate dehydrogenase